MTDCGIQLCYDLDPDDQDFVWVAFDTMEETRELTSANGVNIVYNMVKSSSIGLPV